MANSIPADDPMRKTLDAALDRADEVIAEGRDRVLDLRVPDDASGELAQALTSVGKDLVEKRSMTFRLVVDGLQRPIATALRDEAFRIGREALLNAFVHSDAHSIEVQLVYADEAFRLLVRDDGRGIDPLTLDARSPPGHWGLVGMRERAHAIGARFDIHSRPGAGTEIELLVPGSIAYVDSQPPTPWSFLRRLLAGPS